MLGLAIKSTSLARVAASLVETYLGRDAGRRVLAGRMSRGSVEKIHAVLWFSDIRGYTALSEDMASDQLIPLLDDYAEAVDLGRARRRRRVLKLIGDGVLAIFPPRSAAASRSALGPRRRFSSTLPRSRSAAPQRRCRSPRSMSASTSATSSTAISAARTGSTSPSSARP